MTYQIPKIMGRSTTLIALLGSIAAFWASSDLLRSVFTPVMYERDFALLESGFFESHNRFESDPQTRIIPPQLPGPQDSWAGGEPKEIILQVPVASRARLWIYLMESHDLAPPALEIFDGAKLAAHLEVPKGSGLDTGKWDEYGTRSTLKVSLPPWSGEGPRKITIRSVAGSWMAIERIEIRPISSGASRAALAGGLALLLLAAMSARKDPLIQRTMGAVCGLIEAGNRAIAPYICTGPKIAIVTFVVGFSILSLLRERLVPFSAPAPEKFWRLAGDEPEYMMGANSLAHDGDVDLRNDIASGVGEIIIGLSDYPPAYHGSLEHFKSFAPGMAGVEKDTWGDRQLLVHRSGLSALIAPAAYYPDKMRWVAYLIVSASASALLAIALGFLVADGLAPGPLFLLGMGIFLSPPTIFYGNQASPDSVFPLMAALVAALLWKPTAARTIAAAMVVAAMPWFSDRAIPSGLALGLAALMLAPGARTRGVVLGVFTFGSALLISYYFDRFGTFHPVYHGVRSPVTMESLPKGLLSALLSANRGVLFQAPIFILMAPALWRWWKSGQNPVLLAAVGGGVFLTLALIAGAYPDNSGGVGPAGRFNMALVWLAFPALAAWMQAGISRPGKWILGLFLAAGLAQTALVGWAPWRWFTNTHPVFTYRWARDIAGVFPDLSMFDAASLRLTAIWALIFLVSAALSAGAGAGQGSPPDPALSTSPENRI